MFDEFNVSRSALWSAMDAIGATRAEVHFSGGNDEGGTDRIRVYKGNVELDALDVPERLSDLLDRLPNEKYYTFAGDFEVYGTVIVDRATESVEFSGRESVTVWEEF